MKSYLINTIALALVYGVLLYAMSSGSITRYLRGILMTIFINIILATSLNLTTGFLGQIALGHAGFMSIGAYSAALFVKYIESTGVVLLADGSPTPQGQLFFVLSLPQGRDAHQQTEQRRQHPAQQQRQHKEQLPLGDRKSVV